MGGGVSTNHKSYSIVSHLTWSHPLTHWPPNCPTTQLPNHQHTHPWVGVWVKVSLQIVNVQTELNYLDSVNVFSIFSVLTWPHPSTHPPIYTPTHDWGSLHGFQIFKQNSNILISSSTIEFWLIPRVPPGGWGSGWMGWGMVRECPPHTCTCTCMYAHAGMCTHTCAYDIIGNSQGFPKNPMEAAICMTLSCFPHMHVCVCMCACACVWGANPTTPHPIHPPPPPHQPQGAQNTKIQ